MSEVISDDDWAAADPVEAWKSQYHQAKDVRDSAVACLREIAKAGGADWQSIRARDWLRENGEEV